MKKIFSKYIKYILNNKINFIKILVFFSIGIVVGIFFVNNLSDEQKVELNTYIDNLIFELKKIENINKFDIWILNLKHNISFLILIWFLGCTIIGGIFIYAGVVYKGFLIGYTIAAIIASLGFKKGLIFLFASLFMQNIIFLPIFFLIAERRNKIV